MHADHQTVSRLRLYVILRIYRSANQDIMLSFERPKLRYNALFLIPIQNYYFCISRHNLFQFTHTTTSWYKTIHSEI